MVDGSFILYTNNNDYKKPLLKNKKTTTCYDYICSFFSFSSNKENIHNESNLNRKNNTNKLRFNNNVECFEYHDIYTP